MPIQIDRARTRDLARQFDEAFELVSKSSRAWTHTDNTTMPSPEYSKQIRSSVY